MGRALGLCRLQENIAKLFLISFGVVTGITFRSVQHEMVIVRGRLQKGRSSVSQGF
jgi:hypothetical protein